MGAPASCSEALVNSGSKLATDSSESTMGLNGGVICLRYRRSQSMLLKKGCSLSSAAPLRAPRRFCGLRLSSYESAWSDIVTERLTPLTNCLPSSPITICQQDSNGACPLKCRRVDENTHHAWGNGSCHNRSTDTSPASARHRTGSSRSTSQTARHQATRNRRVCHSPFHPIIPRGRGIRSYRRTY